VSGRSIYALLDTEAARLRNPQSYDLWAARLRSKWLSIVINRDDIGGSIRSIIRYGRLPSAVLVAFSHLELESGAGPPTLVNSAKHPIVILGR
jgi:hypothetical protein